MIKTKSTKKHYLKSNIHIFNLLRQSFVGSDVNVNSDFRPECSWVKVIVEFPDLSSRPERLSLPERLVFHSLQEIHFVFINCN